MRSDEVPLAIFGDAVFLKCLTVRNNETTFLLRKMNAVGRETMAVEDEEKTEPPSQGGADTKCKKSCR